MNPNNKRDDGFQPKWRHFHPQATVWVHNPLDHDVVFNVADEYDNPFQYRMRAGKTSELPGGAVATLGVKALVDELIQNDPKDLHSMWEKGVRSKWEDQIILKIKEAPLQAQPTAGGEVDLSVSDDALEDDDDKEQVAVEEQAFPTRTQTPAVDMNSVVSGLATASLPAANTTLDEK